LLPCDGIVSAAGDRDVCAVRVTSAVGAPGEKSAEAANETISRARSVPTRLA
jgi:hypothetical protein